MTGGELAAEGGAAIDVGRTGDAVAVFWRTGDAIDAIEVGRTGDAVGCTGDACTGDACTGEAVGCMGDVGGYRGDSAGCVGLRLTGLVGVMGRGRSSTGLVLTLVTNGETNNSSSRSGSIVVGLGRYS